MGKSILDLMSVQETKLDESFPANQFAVPNFKMYRKDVTDKSGAYYCMLEVMYLNDGGPSLRKFRTSQKLGEWNCLSLK